MNTAETASARVRSTDQILGSPAPICLVLGARTLLARTALAVAAVAAINHLLTSLTLEATVAANDEGLIIRERGNRVGVRHGDAGVERERREGEKSTERVRDDGGEVRE